MAPPPTRRTLLGLGTSALASLAGCSTRPDDRQPDAPSETDRDTPPRTPTATSAEWTSPTPADFAWTATLAAHGTETDPPSVELSLTNVRDAEVQLLFGATPPFTGPRSEPSVSGAELQLFHPEMGPAIAPDDRIDGCWRFPPDTPATAVNAIGTVVPLRPGETVRETYSLYTPSGTEGCLPDGVYRFADSVPVGPEEAVTMRLSFDATCSNHRVSSVTAAPPSFE